MPWIIDPVHSHVGFSVRHMMVTTVRGRFTSYRGTIELDPNDLTRSRVSAEIDVRSVDTGNADRDGHLRTGDFFGAEDHPVMRFESTKVEGDGDDLVLHGNLTLRGVTKPVELAVEYAGISTNTFGKRVAGFSASGTIKRQDFGVNFHQVLDTGGVAVGDKVKIELDVQAYAEGE